MIGNSVKNIGYRAFYYCKALKSVNFPNSLESIGDWAFYGCYNLTAVNFPNGLESIGDWAFYDCQSLTSIDFPNSLKSIGDFAFANCSFTSITIPEGVESITTGTFSMCPYLTSVTIPSSLTNIGPSSFGNTVTSLFGGCIRLTSIEVANANPSYMSENGVLFNKEKTTLISFPAGKTGSYTIPDGVTIIGEDAFDFECGRYNYISNEWEDFFNDNFTAIVIPSSVETIEAWGIFGCNSLSHVVIKRDTPPTCASYVFDGDRVYITPFNTCILHVPLGSKSLYQEEKPWSYFENIVEDADNFSAIENVQVSSVSIFPNPVSENFRIGGIIKPTVVTVLDINGKVVLQQMVSPNENISAGHLPQGVYFVNVKEKTMKIIKK